MQSLHIEKKYIIYPNKIIVSYNNACAMKFVVIIGILKGVRFQQHLSNLKV